MGVLDENGRVFGVVNVVDLAVVAVVLAMLISGAAFVLADDPEPPEERYLTVVFDERPGGSVPTLGDAIAKSNGRTQLGRTEGIVTDMYVAPTGDSGFLTVARIRVNVSAAAADQTTDRRLVTEAQTYLVGQDVRLTVGDAGYNGYVHAVGRSGPDLPLRTVDATVVAELPPPVADRIQPGDSQRVAGREVVRVVAVDRGSTTGDRTRVKATVELRVFDPNGAPLYGTQHVRPGADVTVAPNGYEFTGTVTEVT